MAKLQLLSWCQHFGTGVVRSFLPHQCLAEVGVVLIQKNMGRRRSPATSPRLRGGMPTQKSPYIQGADGCEGTYVQSDGHEMFKDVPVEGVMKIIPRGEDLMHKLMGDCIDNTAEKKIKEKAAKESAAAVPSIVVAAAHGGVEALTEL